MPNRETPVLPPGSGGSQHFAVPSPICYSPLTGRRVCPPCRAKVFTGVLPAVASNVYESLFILDSNRYARDPGGLSSSVNELVEKLGGTVLASRLWLEQRLAYPIEGHQKGTYW